MGVTLQISLAPPDLPHAVHILPHQLRQWAGQVDEIDLTLDLHRSEGHYGEAWEERRPGIERLAEDTRDRWRSTRLCPVDYSPPARAAVGDAFFGGADVPSKGWTGAPAYAYFYGLYRARHDHVLHLDSDLMFGGGSRAWIHEAVRLMRDREDVVLCSRLAGPPRPDGELPSHVTERIRRWGGAIPVREPSSSLAFRFGHCSSRLFFVDRSRFRDRLCPLPFPPISRRERAHAKLHGNPPYETPERLISDAMRGAGVVRIDFLGPAPGMWSLHPPWRSETFYRELPRLIERVETGDLPEEQLGDYEVGDGLVDWSSVRAELDRPPRRGERLRRTVRRARALLSR